MATITPTITKVTDGGVTDVYIVQWASIGDSDTCTAVPMSGAADRTVQISGTFGGATIVMNGSNDGTNYVNLTDPQGNAISKTSGSAIEAIEELTRYIKPATSGGSSSSVTVTLLMKGQR